MLGACALWALGFNVLPTLHVAFHHLLGPHHHGHHHGEVHNEPRGGFEAESHPHQSRTEGSGHHDSEHDPNHGQGSVAHGDIAVVEAPVSIPLVSVARVARATTDERRVSQPPRETPFHVVRARAPPA